MQHREPDAFRAGDTVEWTRTFSDYPPPTWTLTYTFSSIMGSFTATAVDDGSGGHLVKLTPAQTSPQPDGWYSWVGSVTDGTDRYTVAEGTVQVLPNLQGSGAQQETRSWAKRTLAALEATLEGTATTDQASYSIAGVSLSRMTLGDMNAWRDKLKAEVAREEAADRMRKGLGHPGTILVRL